ncbi:hypothetical protein B0H10DRAFT_2223708 [Mycena sp. CBHHK59/15]|nr:hypothetical protein B0H10DRAFT_2223708 [Mycena sp. CBHHK59/15]
MPTDYSSADMELIDGLPTCVLKDFRSHASETHPGSNVPLTRLSQIFTKSYITANAHVFIDTACIDILALRSFLAAWDRDSARDTIVISSSSPGPSGRCSGFREANQKIEGF